MQIEIDRELFEKAMSKVIGAVNGSAMPVLSNVLLEFDGAILSIGATDLAIAIQTRLPAVGESPARLAAPAGKLLKIARNVSSNKLSISANGAGDVLLVRSGSSKFTLPTILANDFPLMDFSLGAHPVTVDAALLVGAMERVKHAVPTKSEAFGVKGALLHRIGPDLRLVSCDGRRLCYVRIDAAKAEGLEVGDGVVIPLEAIRQVPGIVGEARTVEVAVCEGRLVVSTGDTVMACLLLEEEYPDYKVIVPDHLPHSVVLSRQVVADSVKRLSICTHKGLIHVLFKISNEGLILESGTEDGGTCEDHIPVAWEGPEFNTAYNLSFLNDVIHASTDETLRYSFRDQFSPGVFTPANGGDVLDLIMPMVIG